MHSNTVMNQLLLLLPRHQFDQAVSAFGGDTYVKKFSTWNQLTVLLHAQASGKNSLRDIQTALGTQEPKLYHLGLPAVKRSTLADANAKRDSRIMEKLFHHLLERCQTIAPKHQFRFKNPVRAFDSTTIDLCLELFPWAKFRQTKGAVKLHCQLDLQGQIPLAPHAKIRPHIVPPPAADQPNPPQRPKRAKRWAELLARVFGIDMSTCPDCGGPFKIIAAILDPHAITSILTHLKLPDKPPGLVPARIPEQFPLHTTGGERPSCGAQFS